MNRNKTILFCQGAFVVLYATSIFYLRNYKNNELPSIECYHCGKKILTDFDSDELFTLPEKTMKIYFQEIVNEYPTIEIALEVEKMMNSQDEYIKQWGIMACKKIIDNLNSSDKVKSILIKAMKG